MNNHHGKIGPTNDEVIDYGYPPGNIPANYPCADGRTIRDEKLDRGDSSDSEVLRICQALLLSTCMLLLSYHCVRYGRTEYSILENGQISRGYANKAVVTLSLGYSLPYSMLAVSAIGMLAYSLVWKSPRWSLPSIVLYLADLVYDISSGIVAIWLFFAHFPLLTALSYAIGTILLIFGEIWIWLGVLRLYEQRIFK